MVRKQKKYLKNGVKKMMDKKTLNNLYFITPFLNEGNKKRLMQLPISERHNVINAFAEYLIGCQMKKELERMFGLK